MTVEEYWAAIRRLGLRPSNVSTVYIDGSGETYNVRNPDPMPAEARAEFIRRLQASMGVA
jgi:hypothetical protein